MSKIKRDYDFAGWVTKHDVTCTDGVVIKHDAFKNCDGLEVPTVWNHQHHVPTNILGRTVLEHRDEGVYGYTYLNNTTNADTARELIEHGDINAMSIFANQLKKNGNDVTHGTIREVSLVLAGANPGALIEEFLTHNDSDGECAIISGLTLAHADDEPGEPEEDEEIDEDEEVSLEEVLDTMNDEQLLAVKIIVDNMNEVNDKANEDEDENLKQGDDLSMKNIFEKKGKENEELELVHTEMKEALDTLQTSGMTLQEAMGAIALKHSITNVEYMFPEHKLVGDAPYIYNITPTAAEEIISACHKTPFARIKSLVADLTADEARALGYIKGNEKKEQIFKLMKRTTEPQTIYKKQKMDRDDLIDITDFDVVALINWELKVKLYEELARAVLVGDGRAIDNTDKIQEDKIRPIFSDEDFYTIKKSIPVNEMVDNLIKAKIDYRGSGSPVLYISPKNLADLKVLKDKLGNYQYDTDAQICSRLGVSKIVETALMPENKMIIVNLADYNIGSNRGGELTSFKDFDINFNKEIYLVETRVSGALVKPYSAIAVTILPATPEPDTVIPGDGE